jgi:hypothetical protein
MLGCPCYCAFVYACVHVGVCVLCVCGAWWWLVGQAPAAPRGLSGDHFLDGARVYELSQFPAPGTAHALEFLFPTCLCVAPDGGHVVVGDDAGDLHVWQLQFMSDYETGPVRVVSLTRDESITGPVVKKAVVVAGAHHGSVAALAAITALDAQLVAFDRPAGVYGRARVRPCAHARVPGLNAVCTPPRVCMQRPCRRRPVLQRRAAPPPPVLVRLCACACVRTQAADLAALQAACLSVWARRMSSYDFGTRPRAGCC